MSSRRAPSTPGIRSLTRAARARAPSTASTAVDTASQRKARRNSPANASTVASQARTAPEAVSRCTRAAASTRTPHHETTPKAKRLSRHAPEEAPVQYRSLGRTGWQVSDVSFGAWAIGGAWGEPDDAASMAALHAALDRGVNFFDTADVYGDGRGERLLARLRRERREPFHVATKAGRRLSPHTADGYTKANLTAFVERSLANLETEAVDLLQLHSAPTDVYYRPEVFAALDDLVRAGKIRYYGVSVERV